MTIPRKAVFAERVRRHRLVERVTTPEEYASLFRLLQPVSPVYFSMPGSPPSLVHRTTFDDCEVTGAWRETREIVKGRFLRGTIGYVFSDDLGLYANAFQRPLEVLNRTQELVYSTLEHIGPLTPRQIKEETGLLNKEIMPILHRLQQASLVYEDQLDSDWERPWYIFEQEWSDITIGPDLWEASAREVLLRFLHAHVFATSQQIRDWSGWSARDIRHLLQALKEDGRIVDYTIDELGGWMRVEDTCLNVQEPIRSVFMLHKSDPLVQASTTLLRNSFGDLEVLQYLLIDGDLLGAVCGHWRIGPHDVEEIVLDIGTKERIERRGEVIEAVAWQYHPPHHNILRYSGYPVPPSPAS